VNQNPDSIIEYAPNPNRHSNGNIFTRISLTPIKSCIALMKWIKNENDGKKSLHGIGETGRHRLKRFLDSHVSPHTSAVQHWQCCGPWELRVCGLGLDTCGLVNTTGLQYTPGVQIMWQTEAGASTRIHGNRTGLGKIMLPSDVTLARYMLCSVCVCVTSVLSKWLNIIAQTTRVR